MVKQLKSERGFSQNMKSKENKAKNQLPLNVLAKPLIATTVIASGVVPFLPTGNEVHAANIFAGGDGTQANPYLIETLEQLNAVRNNLNSHFKLTADIDLAGVNWQPIGASTSNAFGGTFDGNGHTIKNLTINSSQAYVGLFGVIKGAKISDLIIESPNVMNTSNSTGALAGWDVGGSIITSVGTENGVINGQSYTGGLIGGIGTNGYSKISQAYSTNQVIGTSYTGGLVGYGAKNHTFTDVFANWRHQGNRLYRWLVRVYR